jgi:hypothetical protein
VVVFSLLRIVDCDGDESRLGTSPRLNQAEKLRYVLTSLCITLVVYALSCTTCMVPVSGF